MSLKERAATYVGIVLFVGGIAISAAFIGYRTADPVAGMVLGDYSLVVRIAGILPGFVVTLCGFGIGVGIGNVTFSAVNGGACRWTPVLTTRPW